MLPTFQRVLLRSSRSCSYSQMKLWAPSTTSTAAMFATALAVTSRYSCSVQAFTMTTFTLVTTRPFGATTLFHSAVAPDEEVSSSNVPIPSTTTTRNDKIVADGTIVSYFGGGLAAVRVSDDVLQSGEESNQSNDLIGHQVQFPNHNGHELGMVVAQRPPMLFVYTGIMQEESCRMMDDKVQILNSKAQVQVTDEMTIVDCFGNPIMMHTTTTTNNDESTRLNKKVVANRDIFAAIPKVADIALINSPMLTGETMIDALAPIGRGQNMLVVGSNFAQMRGLATDFFSTQLQAGSTKCIYAITHDEEAALERLKNAGISDNVIVVSVCNKSADPVTKAAEATAVAATACAIGEAFAHAEGKNSLVIVDSIDDFKILWDCTTRVLVNVFGIDSVVKDDRNGGASSEMRGFYSALIQRAGQFKEKKGGGSVTLALLTSIPGNDGMNDESIVHAVEEFDDCSDKIKARLDVLVKKNIPLTAANLRKIDIPIPSVTEGQKRLVLQHIDDLMSMTDGQIWFDEKLAQQGQEPPMDPQKSVTRIGIGADTTSRADAPAVRRMVEGLRLDLSQAASMDGAEVNAASSKQFRKRNAWFLAMHQEPGQGGRTLAESCIALLAASIGALDDTIEAGGLAGTDLGQSTIQDLIAHVQKVAPDAVREINDSLDSSAARRTELVDAINSFFSSSA